MSNSRNLADLLDANGDVSLGDNVKAKFGASDDLQIYHDGAASWIKDEGTGYLGITTNGAAIYLQKGTSETLAEFGIDGACKFRYDNALKLATTSTGVDVTGSVLVNHSTNAGISFTHTNGSDSALRQTSTGSLILEADTGNETASSRIEIKVDGTERMRIDSSGNVGIGTSSPTKELHVHSATGDSDIHLTNATTGSLGNDGCTLTMTGVDALIRNREAGNVRIYTSDAERMRIDSAGNVGIGTSSPSRNLHIKGSNYTYLRVEAGTTGHGSILELGDSADSDYGSITQFASAAGEGGRMRFTAGGTETMNLRGGNVGIGTSSPAAKLDVVGNINAAGTLKLGSIAAGGLTTTGWSIGSSGTGTIRNNVTNNEAVVFDNTGGTGFYKIDFRRANSSRGGIQVFDTGTSYTTTSDYRLKENVVPMTGSIDRLKELKPSRFNFIADADKTVDGFLAHEAGEVVPECATGTKDAMKDEEYEVTPAVMDGDTVVTEAVMGTRSVPDYQGIDQSKLVPLLVASLQEAIARIEQLEQGA